MSDQPRICDLLVRWEEAKAEGRLLSAEELCADQPDLIDAVRFRIAKLEAVDGWLLGDSNGSTRPTAVGPRQPPPEQEGGYRWQPPGYEILEELGRGGMGVVYLARQVGLGRLVAVKTIPMTALPASSSLARFDLEARAAARLRHPNIVQIYDVGNHAG